LGKIFTERFGCVSLEREKMRRERRKEEEEDVGRNGIGGRA
jgi:hypothetical protein